MFPRAHTEVKSTPSIGVPFAPIPHEILQRRDISSLAKLVFAVIANQARMRRGDSTPMTNAQIAAAVGASLAAVRRALDELEAVGLIDRQYGASERVRASIRVTFDPDRVAQGRATHPSQVARVEQPGCASASEGVAHQRATPLNTKNEEPEKSVVLDSRGTEPKPSPAEVAAAMRAMVGGRFAVMLFDAQPDPEPEGPEVPPAPTPRPPTPPTPNPQPTPPKLDAKAMFRRVGYSAVAAVKRPPCIIPRDGAELRAMREGRRADGQR